MRTLTWRTRRIAAACAALTATGLLALPAAAQASTASTSGYAPNPHQWYFNAWGVQQEVWPTSEGSGVTIGLVDSGVQASLPDLQGVVTSGADMLGNSGNGETDYAPDGGHGTFMAELIAGQGGGNGQDGGSPVGIAPQAKILSVHVLDPSTDFTIPAANGIRYAVNHGVKVINLSIGGPVASPTYCDPSEQSAIAYALAHNVVVVAASGDINKTGTAPVVPSTCAGVLTVGGINPDETLWPGSVQGPQVSVAAPASQIYVENSNGHLFSTTSSGTSGASALVSGVAALIRAAYPSMPWYTVDQRIIDTAAHGKPTTDLGSVPNNGYGYGIVNINRAIHPSQYPVPANAPNPPYARYQAYLKNTGQAGTSTQASPTATATSTGGSGSLGIIIGAVLVVIIAAIVIVIIAVTRSRRGPRGPSGFPPNDYAPPPGQYPPTRQ